MTSLRFTRAQHLKRQGDFLRALKHGVRETRGPLVAHAIASAEGITKSRIGIRIGRRCGNAVLRNRVKRLLRECFRLSQHDWPRPFDLVITVRPHEVLTLPEYQALMAKILTKVVAKSAPKVPAPKPPEPA